MFLLLIHATSLIAVLGSMEWSSTYLGLVRKIDAAGFASLSRRKWLVELKSEAIVKSKEFVCINLHIEPLVSESLSGNTDSYL